MGDGTTVIAIKVLERVPTHLAMGGGVVCCFLALAQKGSRHLFVALELFLLVPSDRVKRFFPLSEPFASEQFVGLRIVNKKRNR